jgi:hypothetical protein
MSSSQNSQTTSTNEVAPERDAQQSAIRAQVASVSHDPSGEDQAVMDDMSSWNDSQFFLGMQAGEDDKLALRRDGPVSGQEGGWITIDGAESVVASLDCNGQVVYTKEMAMIPELRACYQTYLQKGDKKAYHGCVRAYVSKKVGKMDLDGGQLFLKSLGLDDKRDAQIRLCQTTSSSSFSAGKGKVDIFGHVILPALFSGGIGALVLNNRCGRTMDRNEFYVSTAAIALAGVTGTLLGNYFANYQ